MLLVREKALGKGFMIPLVHLHFPFGLTKETPHWFPHDPPLKE